MYVKMSVTRSYLRKSKKSLILLTTKPPPPENQYPRHILYS